MPAYRGRFAPSPTGPLHFGSLATALGSYLDARARGGEWLLRIEDLDRPREQAGSADAIKRVLEMHGLHWDGPVLHQRTRLDAYSAAIGYLTERDLVYACTCSRREIADGGINGVEGPVYPGTCRNRRTDDQRAASIRMRVPFDATISFEDRLNGRVNQRLANAVGDFIVRRADGQFAYQLAVVLDDAFQGITHVVRGGDLLVSTPRQIYLQQLFGLSRPVYMHLPIAVDIDGNKLSKQVPMAHLDDRSPSSNLFRALEFLGQSPPAELHSATPFAILNWAVSHWQPGLLINGGQTRKLNL